MRFNFPVVALSALLSILLFVATPLAQLGNTARIIRGSIAVDEGTVVVTDLRDISTFSVAVVGTGTYQLEFEASFDGGVTYIAVYGLSNASPEVLATNIANTSGQWFFQNRGFSRFRVRASSYSGGAPVVIVTRGYAK